MYEHIRVEVDGQITTVTINRPGALNSLNAAAHRELAAAFDAFADNDDQRVAILTGAGEKAFCAGHDLKQQASGGGLEVPATGFAGLTGRFGLGKPLIAAVNGFAFGGGFEAALACDVIVAAESAVFALPEPRVGLAALAGGIQRLPRVVGLKRAMGVMLTGRRISAREALDWGIVNEIAAGDVISTARKWASEMLACSPMSIRATKEAVLKSLPLSIETAMTDQWNFPAMKAMLESQDAVEGPAAFAEKRSPCWKGR